MCGTCGCGDEQEARDRHDHDHLHHDHDHEHAHAHGPDHHHDHSHEPSPRARLVRIERDMLEKNDRFAAANRRLFASAHVLALNLVSSPGAGKTTLLVRTLQDRKGKQPLAVIEGDQQTSLDADRIQATGVPAVQINTGKMCHLDAGMISDAMGQIPIPSHGVLFVENVGNLVCPAGFDLGEAGKVVLVSVTEGEDKPLKYPDMFHAARLVLVHQGGPLAAPGLRRRRARAQRAQGDHHADVLRVSTRTGAGLGDWYAWLDARLREAEAA